MALAWYWIDTEVSGWSELWLNGVRIPGIAMVSVDEERDIDIKKASGTDKAPTVDNGGKPATVTITLQLPSRAEWVGWQSARANVVPSKPGGGTGPVTIQHPQTDLAGVKQIIVAKVTSSEPTAKSGMTVKIKAHEYVKAPKPVKPRAKAALAHTQDRLANPQKYDFATQLFTLENVDPVTAAFSNLDSDEYSGGVPYGPSSGTGTGPWWEAQAIDD